MSPGRAPARVTARPGAISPSTVMLMETKGNRLVSPPISRILSRRAARPIPRRNSSSQPRSSIGGQTERQEEEPRSGAHRGEVAGGANERFVADGIRRMALREEVNSFEKGVAAQHPSDPGAGARTAASSPIPRETPPGRVTTFRRPISEGIARAILSMSSSSRSSPVLSSFPSVPLYSCRASRL